MILYSSSLSSALLESIFVMLLVKGLLNITNVAADFIINLCSQERKG